MFLIRILFLFSDICSQNTVIVNIKKVAAHEIYEGYIRIPKYATPGSAAVDLHAHIPGPLNGLRLYPHQRVTVPTGIAIEIPVGYEGQVRPRSGLAELYGITVLNSPGTIDSDYRGQIYVILLNFGDRIYTINNNDRIAQLSIVKINRVQWREVSKLKRTKRGCSGLGSTGTGPLETINLDSDPDSDLV